MKPSATPRTPEPQSSPRPQRLLQVHTPTLSATCLAVEKSRHKYMRQDCGPVSFVPDFPLAIQPPHTLQQRSRPQLTPPVPHTASRACVLPARPRHRGKREMSESQVTRFVLVHFHCYSRVPAAGYHSRAGVWPAHGFEAGMCLQPLVVSPSTHSPVTAELPWGRSHDERGSHRESPGGARLALL